MTPGIEPDGGSIMTTQDSPNLPKHVRENRDHWDGMADQWVAPGERAWASSEPFWGVWSLPDAEVSLLPGDMTGLDAIELGCGTGYVSGWMARRGARVVAIDNSERQLDTARRLSRQHGVEIELLHGNAETVPCPDASFDFAVSEYGAAIWCDPHLWIPEAHRLLRPGGELAFLASTPLAAVATPLDGSPVGDLHREDPGGGSRLGGSVRREQGGHEPHGLIRPQAPQLLGGSRQGG